MREQSKPSTAKCPKGLLKDLSTELSTKQSIKQSDACTALLGVNGVNGTSRIVRDTASRRAASPLGHIASRRNRSLYILFLLAEPKYVSCVRLSEVMKNISHDSVNRFLLRENYTPQDLFDEVKNELILEGGIVSVDDSVLDKPYTNPKTSEIIVENLKFLRNEKMGFLFGIANNRQVSLERGTFLQVQKLTIPESGLLVYLREFGWVKVFCQNFKKEVRHYIMYLLEEDQLKQIDRQSFRQIHDRHWQIESFHRVIKQVCNIERFQVRTESGIRTHLFGAMPSFQSIANHESRRLDRQPLSSFTTIICTCYSPVHYRKSLSSSCYLNSDLSIFVNA